MRIALGIEYDGSRFNGWQRQVGVRTVQAELEQALAAVADHAVATTCAGRTDSGVHAAYQVAHFDSEAERSERAWVLGANSRLPADVSVVWARPVDERFHARFSALARAYSYIVVNRQSRPGLWAGRVSWECRPLEVDRMHAAAQAWLGEHDFSSFRAKGCQARHPVRRLHVFSVQAHDGLVIMRVEANAFLQHMVRNFAGVLLAIGRGDRPVEWAAELLALRSRALGGVTAPPHGLYLDAVHYPPAFDLPRPPTATPRPSAFAGTGFRYDAPVSPL